MNRRGAMALLFLVALLISTPAMVDAQRPTSLTPSGNHIIVKDGDVVVVENNARVGIVQRREARVRLVFNAAERWLVVLADHATPSGPPDGQVDWTYHYNEVGGEWPFDARWEGAATIDEYSTIPRAGYGGLGITTPRGLVQVFGREQEFRDRDAVAVLSYMGAGGGGGANQLGFDETERWAIAQVRRTDGRVDLPPGNGVSTSLTVRGGLIGGVSGGITGGVSDSGIQVDGNGAVRVGGPVRPPKKIADVRPAMPEDAARTGIRGIVIIEVTIDVDGTVKDARVLRSIPMLDVAALDAVRQWRFEPTVIDGRALPVVMTVTVQFL
jgi:TonB family protein